MFDYQSAILELSEDLVPKPILKGWQRPCKWRGLVLRPMEKGKHKATAKSLSELGLAGLDVSLSWGTVPFLYIRNSPQKVMHNGFNHTDFTLTQMTEFISLVSERIGIPYWDAKPVGRIEFAVNLHEDFPNKLIDDLDTHKLKSFDLMKGARGKVYGKRSQVNAIKPKIYNPFLKERLSSGYRPNFLENIIRCECVSNISYLRKRGININTVKDYSNSDILKKLGNLLSQSMKEITFKGHLTNTNYKELKAYYFFRYATKEEIKNFKMNQESTYWRHRKIYLRLEKEKSERSNDLPERIMQKWNLLSTS